MSEPKPFKGLHPGYTLPEAAGPAWRAAAEMGIDMNLLEEFQKLTPWERMVRNDRYISYIFEIREPLHFNPLPPQIAATSKKAF